MNHIVEVKILNDTLLIPCAPDITIAQLIALSVAEYEQTYMSKQPLSVQCVKDSKGRILSGSIKLIAMDLEKYVEIVLSDNSDCDIKVRTFGEVISNYSRMQHSAANQILKYVRTLITTEHMESPCKEASILLENLKHSYDENVQKIVVDIHKEILLNSRKILNVKFSIDELIIIIKNTIYPSIVIQSLCTIKAEKNGHKFVDFNQLTIDVSSIAKKFHQFQEEILKAFDSIDMGNQIPLSANESLVNQKNPENFLSPTDKTKLRVEDTNTLTTNNGMSRSRIEDLLQSDDIQCRAFALEKISRSKTAPLTLLSLLPSQGAARVSFGSLYELVSCPSDHISLIHALLVCTTKSLKPPSQLSASISKASNVRTSQGEQFGTIYPTAYYVATAIVNHVDSNPQHVTLSLAAICALLYYPTSEDNSFLSFDGEYTVSDEQLESIQKQAIIPISEKWRLLVSLIHLQDPCSDIATMSCSIIYIIIKFCHWNRFDMKLQKESVLYFIDSEMCCKRLYIGLSFLLNMSKQNFKGNQCIGGFKSSNQSQINKSYRSFSSSENSDDCTIHIEDVLSSNKYAILKYLYHWVVSPVLGNGRQPIHNRESSGNMEDWKSEGVSSDVIVELAVEALSSFVVLSSVKAFVMKYDVVEHVSKELCD